MTLSSTKSGAAMHDVMPWIRMDSAAPRPASVAASMRRTPFFFSTTDWMSVLLSRMSDGSTPGRVLHLLGLQLARARPPASGGPGRAGGT